jgi:hypothetical protein
VTTRGVYADDVTTVGTDVLNFRLRPDERAAIQRLAEALGCSNSDVVRLGVRALAEQLARAESIRQFGLGAFDEYDPGFREEAARAGWRAE